MKNKTSPLVRYLARIMKKHNPLGLANILKTPEAVRAEILDVGGLPLKEVVEKLLCERVITIPQAIAIARMTDTDPSDLLHAQTETQLAAHAVRETKRGKTKSVEHHV